MTIGAETFRIGGKTGTFAIFAPDEIAAVAGLSPALEEAWRQWGYLPWGRREPQAVTATAAVDMAVSHRLALHGVLPSDSGRICGGSVAIVFWYALLNSNGACEVSGPPGEVEEFLCKFYNNDRLASELTGVRSSTAYKYLFRRNGFGEFERSLDLESIIGTEISTNYEIIDLARIAEEICAGSQRPLIHVELKSDIPKSRWIKRLTYRVQDWKNMRMYS